MDTRSTYLRRHLITTRLQMRLAMAVLAGVGCGVAILAVLPGAHLERGHGASAAAPVVAQAVHAPAAAQAKPGTARRIYPFSIIPGGVASRDDVARMVRTDPVVALHYAGFAVDKAQLQTVPAARAVYVSYRKGDQVFWTKHKVMLAEGETVLSDGTNLIRGRCGNRISETARYPVEANGPSTQVLDSYTEAPDDGVVDTAYGDAAPAPAPAGSRYDVQTFPVNTGSGPAVNGTIAAASGIGPSLRDADLPLYASRTGTIAARSPAATPVTDTPTDTVDTGVTPVDTASPPTSTPPVTPVTPEGPVLTDTSTPPPTTDAPPLPWPPQLPTAPTTPVTTTDTVPEPGSLWLSGIAFAALVVGRRRSRAKAGRSN